MADSRSDKALVEAANRGDERAFEALYLRYRSWVVRLAYRFTGSREDALDVLQETFGYVLRKLPALRLKASVTTFLYPVVKHLSLNVSRKKMQHLADDEISKASAPPEVIPTCRKELAAVMRVLPEGQREVVLMRFVDDMTLEEIAGALNIPVGTVKSRLHNALDTLRRDPRTHEYFLD